MYNRICFSKIVTISSYPYNAFAPSPCLGRTKFLTLLPLVRICCLDSKGSERFSAFVIFFVALGLFFRARHCDEYFYLFIYFVNFYIDCLFLIEI